MKEGEGYGEGRNRKRKRAKEKMIGVEKGAKEKKKEE